MTGETTAEDQIAALRESGQIMFVAINAVFQLHAAVEAEDVVVCGYCTALANEDIFYPCPTTSILLADMVVDEVTSPEPSEPAESEEPSS